MPSRFSWIRITLSPSAVEEAITGRTRAIVAVHYGGYPVDFDALLPIVRKHNLKLIEDCAHAHATEWKGRRVGAIGDFGGFSFQQSKSLTAGEGGVVLTDDDNLAERALLLHNIGRIVGRPGYEHHVLASNYRMQELQAALLLSQMRRLPEQTKRKHENGEWLATELAQIGGVDPLKRDPRIIQRGYYFFIIKYNKDEFGGVHRDKFLQALNAEGVPAGAGYTVPLYKQSAFKRERVQALLSEKLGPIPDYENMFLPIAEEFCAQQQITIPHQVLLAEKSELQGIVDAVIKIKDNADQLRVT